jgi:PST family polysaccharide transporter
MAGLGDKLGDFSVSEALTASSAVITHARGVIGRRPAAGSGRISFCWPYTLTDTRLELASSLKALIKSVVTMGTGTGVSILCSVAVVKYIAISLGPAGTGLYSILLQVYASALAVATLGGGAQNSVIRGVARHCGNDRRILLETALTILLATTAVAAVSVFVFGTYFIRAARKQTQFLSTDLLNLIVLGVFAGLCASMLLAVINGYREMPALAGISVINSVASAVLVVPAVYFVKRGYPVAFVLMITIAVGLQGITAMIFIHHRGWFHGMKLFRFCKSAAKDFIGLAGATLLAGIVAQGGALLLQASILKSFGLESVGILNAAVAISTGYPMLLLNAITAYYLPTLSGGLIDDDAKFLIRNMYRFALLAGVPLITFVIAFQPVIITILYSNRFIPALAILRWMLIGALFKTVSWIFATPVTARGELGLLIISEVAFNIVYTGAAIAFSNRYHSLQVVGICYMVAYMGYLGYYVLYIRSRYPCVIGVEELVMGVAGTAIVLFASYVVWNRTRLSPYGLLLCMLALVGSWCVLSSRERAKVREAVSLRLRRNTTG